MERISQGYIKPTTVSTLQRIIFIAALLLMNFRVNIVGSMSLTEIFVVIRIPHLLQWVNTSGRSIPYLHKIYKAFLLLVVVQCIAEAMVGNTLINAAKGIAITVMALFLMLFYLEYLVKDIRLLVWVPICSILGLLIFGDQFGFADESETQYFKFYVAPIVASGVCALTMLRNKFVHKNLYTVFFFASLFVIIGGARSLGFSLFFTVFGIYVFNRYRTISFKKILPVLIICAIIIQSFLTFVYMPNVKSGQWGSEQNRQQFSTINWNSNIFMILFSARTDFVVSAVAFMDKPLWGHGSWATDRTLKYHILLAELHGEEYKPSSEEYGYVPTHSVVLSKGVSNGIFAFLVFLWIFIMMYRIGLKGLSKGSIYNPYLIWTIISSFQHLMFGPPAILKNNGSIAFAIMFALFYLKYSNSSKVINK